MSLTESFIRRPVMTVLLNLAIVMAGAVAIGKIPVAALPSYNTPIIQVTAVLPGASPETMASSVALPLEKQFSTIAGLATISSTNNQGQSSLVLEFETTRDIDAAAVDVQAALFRAQRALPAEMTTPPSYRKVNPADAPVLILALTSPSMERSELNEFAENLIAPTLSTSPPKPIIYPRTLSSPPMAARSSNASPSPKRTAAPKRCASGFCCSTTPPHPCQVRQGQLAN